MECPRCGKERKNIKNSTVIDTTAVKLDKEFLLNLYKNYKKEYKGIKTHIELLDDVIGVLGYKSLAIVGAPQGHGKSK